MVEPSLASSASALILEQNRQKELWLDKYLNVKNCPKSLFCSLYWILFKARLKILKASMPNYVPATIEDGVEPREEPLELLDGKRARLVAEVGAGQGERAARAEAAHLADEGVVGDPGRRVVRFHLHVESDNYS